jgi:molybdopterin-containing oxidoreductase family iron-sulfur binding subunit
MSNRNDQPDMKRREFIGKTILAGGAITVASGVLLTLANANQAGKGASSETRWGMLIDTNKCADDCTACVDSCNKENGMDLLTKPDGQSDEMWAQQKPQWIRKVKLKDKQTGEVSNLPLMCQHCEHPPCVDVCRYCMMACPYKARSFIHQDIEHQSVNAPRGKGCVESCNLCVNRIDAGTGNTACSEACAADGHNAIVFGDLNDPDSAVAKALQEKSSRQIRADLELNTGVRYTNV